MRTLKTNKIFVSVFQASKDLSVNLKNHEYALKVLKSEGIAYRVIKGCYQGIEELSILLEASDVRSHDVHIETALNLARLFNQDSVLEVSNDDSARLYYLGQTFKVEELGRFTEVSESQAKSLQAFSHDPESGRYWTVQQ